MEPVQNPISFEVHLKQVQFRFLIGNILRSNKNIERRMALLRVLNPFADMFSRMFGSGGMGDDFFDDFSNFIAVCNTLCSDIAEMSIVLW